METDQGRQLQVVGDVLNDTEEDLTGAILEATLKSSPVVRVEASIGYIPAGKRTTVDFALPLGETDSPDFAITGIEAKRSSESLFPVTVEDVTWDRTPQGSVRVTASLANPTDEGLQVWVLCFDLLGSSNKPVGGSCAFPPWIGPRETVTVSQGIQELAATRSVKVSAYGEPSTGQIIFPPQF